MAAVGTTHHIRIGDDYHLIRLGSYERRGAPLFGSRFTTGDPDYNNLTLWQYWVQTCWIGGMGAETWIDDAMYDEGVGVDTSQHEVAVLARDLGPNGAFERGNSGGNWDLEGGVTKRQFIEFNDKLYCLSTTPAGGGDANLYVFDDATEDWGLVHNFPSTQVLTMCAFRGRLYFGDDGAQLSIMSTAEAFTGVAKPSGITDTPRMMMVYRDRMYVGFGTELWRMKPDGTWDGSTAFFDAVGINRFSGAEVHLGFLYFSSANGHILRTDGNNTFDLWAFDGGVTVSGLRSYDGRLFVAVNEPLVGTTAAQGVLYQFTGSAVTELKRWGRDGHETSLGRLRVIGNRLFYGASDLLGIDDGFGIAVYDAIEDAHHIWSAIRDAATYAAGTENTNYQVDDVFFWKGYVYCSVRGHGIFRTVLTYRDFSRYLATYDTSTAGASEGAQNGGWWSSSDFDAGTPGLVKMWDAVTVHVDLPTSDCSAHVEYSLDGGATWIDLGAVTKTGSETRYATELPVRDGQEMVTATRFKYRVTVRSTDSTRTPAVRGVVVRYLPIPEPTWEWDFRIYLSESQELLDGTVDDLTQVELEAKRANILNAYRNQTPVEFYDVDWEAGDQRVRALILDCQERIIAPTANSDGAKESEIRLRLIELDQEAVI